MESNEGKKRFKFLIILLLISFFLILLKLVQLTTQELFNKKNRETRTVFERGEILDVNLQKLAISLKVYSLFCNPVEMHKVSNKKIDKLSKILDLNKKSLKKKFLSKKRFVWIKRKVDYTTLQQVLKVGIKGIYYVKEYKRFYPNSRLCSHILGIVGIDNIGLEGIELYYDKYLNSMEDDKGLTLVLTIDKNIQFIVENELREAYKKTKAKSATAIVMIPSTGEIVAMANMPDFDPNKYQKFSIFIRKNRAISQIFEPGSIFKIFTAAAILNEKVTKPTDIYYCPGYIMIGNKMIKCWKRHNKLNFYDVIKESCNVGIITATLKISRFKFYDYLRNFNIGNYTGIDLPGEARGSIRSPKGMGLFSQASISLGQEVGTTAIQLITAASSIFNDGRLMEPHILKKVLYSDGRIYKTIKPVIIRQAIPVSVARKVSELLKGVVEEGGTGELAYIKGFSIAGKTGTGEIYDKKKKKYEKEKVNSSFIGFFPAENTKYAIIVTIHEPRVKNKTGGKVAAPVFKKIVEKIIAYHPIFSKNNVLKFRSTVLPSPQIKQAIYTNVPDLRGKNIREVVSILKFNNMKFSIIGSGIVKSQSPLPGTKYEKDMIIKVYLSSDK